MKWIEKRVNLVMLGTIVLLYLCSMAALLLRDAGIIQEQMQGKMGRIAEDAVERLKDTQETLGEDSTREQQLFFYQQLMADNADGLSTDYPFRCVSYLTGFDQESWSWNQPIYSRNALFVTVTWDDGTTQQIPMVFRHENSADVAQLLLRLREWYDGEETYTGYFQDGFFYLQEVSVGSAYADYVCPLEPPEDVNLETIRVICEGSIGSGSKTPNAERYQVKTAMKSYGGNSQYAAFASEWEADDALLDEFFNGGWIHRESRISWPEEELRSEAVYWTIFHTRVVASVPLEDPAQLCSDNNRMYFVFVGECVPLALAWGQMIGSRMFWVILVLFLLSGAFLNMTYNYARHKELRSYRDEITRQEQALEYAHGAEQSRREMTSAIAHELKTPIAVLSSYAEALQENIDAEKQSHYLSVIREETGKMDRMVLELLDLSRLEAGRYRLQRRYFDLEELAAEIIDPLMPQIEAKHLNLTWQVGEPMVTADRYRIGQVVENFMTNAIRHTPDGGKIVLRIGMKQETFSVENQGKQIPQEQLNKVWETFWQGDSSRNDRGSGLGLAICRTIITLHGGSCKAENTSAGVRFSMSLSAEQKLYQQGRMPQEEIIRLDYPIASWYTTVERVMVRLELLQGRALLQELEAGTIRLGENVIRDKRTRLYPGYQLFWKEFCITIRLDDDNKRRALLMERMRTGGIGNPDRMKSAGYMPGK